MNGGRRVPRKALMRSLPAEGRAAIKNAERATGNKVRVYEMPDGKLVLDYQTPKAKLGTEAKPV